MAKTLRSRVAAVAVAALGAGLLSAVPANAAVTASVTLPSAVRAGASAPAVTFSVKNTGDTSAYLGLVALAVPASSATPVAQTSGTLANAASVASGASASLSVTPGSTKLDLPGVYTVGVFKAASATTYTAGDTIVTTFSVTVGGAPNAFALTSGTAAIGGWVKLAASYTDASGRATLPLSTEALTLTAGTGSVAKMSATSAGTYNATLALTGSSVSAATVWYAKGQAAGSATVTGALSTNGVAAGSSTVTVVASATDASIAAAAPKATVTSDTDYGVVATATAGTYDLRELTAQTLTAKIPGLTANSGVNVTVTGSGFTTSNPAVVTDASGVATVTIAVDATPVDGDSATLKIDSTGSTTVLTIHVVASGSTALTVTPAVSVVAPGATVTFTATATGDDVFGDVPADTTRIYIGVGSAIYASALTKNGVATFTFTAPATAGDYTVKFSDSTALSGGAYNATAAVHVTTTGKADSLTLADNDTSTGTATDDNASTRAIPLAPANLTAGNVANTDNAVKVSVTTASPAALPFTATTTSGLRLFTADPSGAALAAGKTTVTGTAGTTYIYAVPTKVGAQTFTVTSGGLSQTFTVTGKLATGAKAQLVTLTKGTATAGKVNYQIKTTDIFGNAVSATVDLVLSGAGTLSNGFKSHTLTTSTAGTNEFDVLSATAGSATITATIQDASYTAVTSAQATAQSISASAQSASDTVAITAAVDPLDAVKAQVTALQTTITSIQTAIATLVASISATLTVMQSSINKIIKKLKIK